MGTAILDNCTIYLVWLFKITAASIMIFFSQRFVAILFPPFNYVKKKRKTPRNAAKVMHIHEIPFKKTLMGFPTPSHKQHLSHLRYRIFTGGK